MTTILAIESSCDETAAAILRDGRELLANVVASQIELHKEYGGVFPEMASRQHIVAITPVVRQALQQAGLGWSDIDAIAAVHGPGLAGSLLVGLNAAKALAYARGLPLVGVNHLEAHIYANWLPMGDPESPSSAPPFPQICLIVSGGHTDLILVHDHHDYLRLGGTVDDAAGEAFDKVARLLGLGYPGGPVIQKTAESGDDSAYRFPRALRVGPYDFSFSGLKTAVLRVVQEQQRQEGQAVAKEQKLAHAAIDADSSALSIPDLAASFQAAVVDALVAKTAAAAEAYDAATVLLAGGVAANARLRQEIVKAVQVPVRMPPIRFCTDNAGMVAMAGHYRYLAGLRSGLDLDVVPNLKLVPPTP